MDAEPPTLGSIISGKQEVERQARLGVQPGSDRRKVLTPHGDHHAASRRRPHLVARIGYGSEQFGGVHRNTVKSRAMLAAHSNPGVLRKNTPPANSRASSTATTAWMTVNGSGGLVAGAVEGPGENSIANR